MIGDTLLLMARLWRSEGPRSVVDRIADRVAEVRRRARMERLAPRASWSEWSGEPPPPVLNLMPLPPVPRRGGASIQLLDRLAVEAERRAVALLYPDGRGWRLEWWVDGRRGQGWFAFDGTVAGCVAAVDAAATATGAPLVHLEFLGELPVAMVPALAEHDIQVVLGVHDFSLFCRRPHLLEEPVRRFCGYCTDEERCRRCLGQRWAVNDEYQARYRRAGAAALLAAAAVVYPSRFMCERHAALFPHARPRREAVIPPVTRMRDAGPRSVRGDAPHLAVVGGVQPAKGGELLAGVLEGAAAAVPGLLCTAFGGGDSELLRVIRRQPGVRVRGYYRAGRLPSLLARAAANLALLASIVPESYGLVVDECLRAGLPVVAFDHGAVGDRLRSLGVGTLVSPAAGAAGLARGVVEAFAAGPAAVGTGVVDALPEPADVARRYVELYEGMGA